MSEPRGTRKLFTPNQCHNLKRCQGCCWHTATQGHHPNCPYQKPPTEETK